MKHYVPAELEVIRIESIDIIANSGDTDLPVVGNMFDDDNTF